MFGGQVHFNVHESGVKKNVNKFLPLAHAFTGTGRRINVSSEVLKSHCKKYFFYDNCRISRALIG